VLLAWIPMRERPGLGTVSSIVVISVAIDVMLPRLPTPAPWVCSWSEVATGMEGSTLLGGRVGVGTALFALVIGPAVAGGLRLVRWFPGRG